MARAVAALSPADHGSPTLQAGFTRSALRLLFRTLFIFILFFVSLICPARCVFNMYTVAVSLGEARLSLRQLVPPHQKPPTIPSTPYFWYMYWHMLWTRKPHFFP